MWEEGKKVRWFAREEVFAIESGQVEDLSEIFADKPEESNEKIAEFSRQFLPPSQFFMGR